MFCAMSSMLNVPTLKIEVGEVNCEESPFPKFQKYELAEIELLVKYAVAGG
jgi:hypothetical protein